MDNILTLLLIGVAIVSIVPVINLNKSYQDKKYLCLKYLINVAFLWTVLVFIKLLTDNLTIIYYAHILTFPIKFILAGLMVCTLLNYIDKKIPIYLTYAFYFIVLFEIVFAMTNQFTGYFIEVDLVVMSSIEEIVNAAHGPLFIFHLILTYSILLIGISYLLIYLKRNQAIRQYKQITYTMVFSVVIVLMFNLLQLVIIETSVDLTYVSLVLVAYLLYRVIYTKDMIFNLKTSGRGEILSNMREMYLLTDNQKNIVEISRLLIDKYHIDDEEYIGKNVEELIENLKDQIIFYSEYDVDNEHEDDSSKDHFHLREKKFKLKGMNEFGYMILLYDQTQVFNLLRELNKLSNYDSMTGLHNRNYIENQLRQLNHQSKLGVLSLDLNGLKVNNDYLGHERGDYLLKMLSKKMKEVMEPYHHYHLARIGGDEFLIVLENASMNLVRLVEKEILKRCDDDHIEEKISVSIGVAFSEEEIDIYQLIQDADAKMYDMKRKVSPAYKASIVEYVTHSDKYIR